MNKLFLIGLLALSFFALSVHTVHAQTQKGAGCAKKDVFTYKAEQMEKRAIQRFKSMYRAQDGEQVCRQMNVTCQQLCESNVSSCFDKECAQNKQTRCYDRLDKCIARCSMDKVDCSAEEAKEREATPIPDPIEDIPDSDSNSAPAFNIH